MRQTVTAGRRVTALALWAADVRQKAIALKLVGMSRALLGRVRDLGFCGLAGGSGRVEVVVAGALDEVIFGHDREETLAWLARSRS
jgi:hypothetical protein